MEKNNANRYHFGVSNIMDGAYRNPDIPGDSLLQRSCIQQTVDRISDNLSDNLRILV